MPTKVLNAVLFQLSWFSSVVAAANGQPWVGPVVVGAWLCWHLSSVSNRPGYELKFILAAGLTGWIADSTLVNFGLISFSSAAQFGFLSPLWMVGLWCGFAATLGYSMAWLQGRWWLAAMLGLVAGPLAYRGGEAIGALQLNPDGGLAAVGLMYLLATPALLLFAPSGAAKLNSADDPSTAKSVEGTA